MQSSLQNCKFNCKFPNKFAHLFQNCNFNCKFANTFASLHTNLQIYLQICNPVCRFANLIANSFGQEKGESVENGGLLGWADGVTWQPNLDAGMFVEMASNGGETTFYPKMISLSMNFNVLHHGDPKAVPVLNGDSRNVDFPILCGFGP